MLRKVSLVATLAMTMGLFSQTYTSPGLRQGTNQPAAPPIVVMPASPNIYIVGGGTYGTGVYVTPAGTLPVQGAGLYLTPAGTLPLQGAGISFAEREGISLQTPLQTGAGTYLPSAIPGMPIYGAASAVAGPEETAAAEPGRPINDLGPSYYAGAVTAAAAPEPSLGEVAAYYKAHPRRSVRSFTNADAQRLANTVTIPGALAAPGPPQTPQQTPPAKKPPAQKPPPQ